MAKIRKGAPERLPFEKLPLTFHLHNSQAVGRLAGEPYHLHIEGQEGEETVPGHSLA